MKFHPATFLALSFLLMLIGAAPVDAQQASLRRFTLKGTNQSFSASVQEKTDSDVTFKLQDGRIQKLAIVQLSDPDQLFVRKWNKFKDKLLNNSEFAALSVKELLELVNYQSFEFVVEGNHIFFESELNGKKAKMMVDTGAHSSVIQIDFAKEAKLEVGPMDQIIYGIAGKQEAAVCKVPVLKVGDAVIENRKLLAADLFKDIPGPKDFDAIFGADFLRELDAVISYREGRMFLKPGNLGKKVDDKTKPSEVKRWTSTDGKVFVGAIDEKTETTATFRMQNGQMATVAIDKFVPEDQELIKKWSKLRDDLAKRPELFTLTVKELLELRGYQSFEYKLDGNHIMVDGLLNETKARFMIDTGAHSGVIHTESADKAKIKYGPFDHEVHGIGGIVKAATAPGVTIKFGDVVVKDRTLDVIDLFKITKELGGMKNHDAIFGADFLRELDGVVNYKEGRIFLKPDNSDNTDTGKKTVDATKKEDAPVKSAAGKDEKSK